jgi:hypothetical protein
MRTIRWWLAAAFVTVLGGCQNATTSGNGGEVDKPPEKEPNANCDPVSVYGPKPCDSDLECRQDYGPEWYCDDEHSYDDGCGGEMNWPICRKK